MKGEVEIAGESVELSEPAEMEAQPEPDEG